jgi:transposase-like protein
MVKPYSMDLRERVVWAVTRDGLSRQEAARTFGVAASTSINWVKRLYIHVLASSSASTPHTESCTLEENAGVSIRRSSPMIARFSEIIVAIASPCWAGNLRPTRLAA